MRVEIITIGDELLWGGAIDSNAAFLGRRLLQLGFPPRWQTTVGDDLEAIKGAVTLALERANLVLVTGGLGATEDDITRSALAQVLGRRLVLDEQLLENMRQHLSRRERQLVGVQQRMALIPQGSRVLPNRIGLAQGLSLETSNTAIYVLPGVPREMETLFDEQVAPILKGIPTQKVIRRKRLRTVGIGETAIAEKISGRQLAGITLSYLPGPWSVDLWLTARAPLARDAENLLTQADRQIHEQLEDQIYGVDDDTLERVVAALLIMKGNTIAVAESCTGGLLASRLTDIPGSSAYYECGMVAYSEKAKRQILKVPKSILDRHGAVSQETATAMARGVRRLSGTDLGLAITGIAGPAGATADKPVGLVFIALAHTEGLCVERFLFGEERLTNKECAVRAALNMVRLHLLNR